MKKLHFLLRITIFWLVFFTLCRAAFALYYKSDLPAGQASDTLKAFIIGLRIDVATTCYLIIVPYILYLFSLVKPKKIWLRITNIYQVVAVALLCFMHILNTYLYQHWGTLINARIFMYAKYLKEDMSFINNKELTFIILAWLGSIALFYWFYRVIVHKAADPKSPHSGKYRGALLYLLFIPFIIIGMRGGLQFTPMNESIIYYSRYSINNNLASNIPWHLGFSLLDENDSKNPFVTMPFKEANAIVHKMLTADKDSTTSILNTERPNIVVVMLESWTADVIKELNGDTATTPCFDTLRKHGLLFTQAYASGSRTDQGLASIISGFPSQPNRSIINMPEKAKKLPCLTEELIKQGYTCSYYYGGDADFANMKIYLLGAHMNIVDKQAFPSEETNGRLGIQDEYVYSRQLQGMNTEKQPFFSLIMTLSSHEPFEVPCHHVFDNRDDVFERFRNAIYYSDSCLARYLSNAAKQKWFDNTLFVLVSDHGNYIPLQRDAYSPEAHHIVIMLYGGALKKEYCGKEIHTTTDQCDIAAMLYGQMHLDHSKFPWSKDVFNPSAKKFAFTANDVEAGIVSGKQHLVFSFYPYKIRDFYIGDIPADSLYTCAKAYLQVYYQQYLDY